MLFLSSACTIAAGGMGLALMDDGLGLECTNTFAVKPQAKNDIDEI
jgi:hypothetical protein